MGTPSVDGWGERVKGALNMQVLKTKVGSIDPGPDMRVDPAVGLYVDTVAALGPEWGRVVVLDPQGRVVLGRRRYDRAVRAGELVVPTARVDVSGDEARLLRLADFAEADGLLLLTLERILSGAASGTGGSDRSVRSIAEAP